MSSEDAAYDARLTDRLRARDTFGRFSKRSSSVNRSGDEIVLIVDDENQRVGKATRRRMEA